MILDAHSHRPTNDTQILVNVHTLAVHPWELKTPFSRSEFDTQWRELTKDPGSIYAIGECGLDRAHVGIASIEDQVYVLEKHFELADKLNLPIILHTVRAYSDLLHMLKQNHFKNHIMLHAFGGNEHEMHELLKYPVYFSYGKRLFNTDKMLKMTPIDRLLLESGDQDLYTISQIYHKAAESLSMDEKDLEVKLERNFLTFFNKLDNVSAADFIKDLNTRKSR